MGLGALDIERNWSADTKPKLYSQALRLRAAVPFWTNVA